MTWNSKPHYIESTPKSNTQFEYIDNAINCLKDAIDSGTAFLWTGGKEAQVLADMLLYGIGEEGEQPVPFITIDTGNAFEEMYEFREDFVTASGDSGVNTVGPFNGIVDWRVVRYEELLDKVINNPEDPRSYHGRWNSDKELPNEVVIDGLPRSKSDWGVPESCGALKTVPIRKIVNDIGIDKLITGRRNEDPLVDNIEYTYNTRNPVPHTRVAPLVEWDEPNVYAYLKKESVSMCSLYTDQGYKHTDSKCCTDSDKDVGEYGEGGRDPEKVNMRKELQEMGYI